VKEETKKIGYLDEGFPDLNLFKIKILVDCKIVNMIVILDFYTIR